jgi:hypothetical protein
MISQVLSASESRDLSGLQRHFLLPVGFYKVLLQAFGSDLAVTILEPQTLLSGSFDYARKTLTSCLKEYP